MIKNNGNGKIRILMCSTLLDRFDRENIDSHHHQGSLIALLTVLSVLAVKIKHVGQHAIRRDDEANGGRSRGRGTALVEARTSGRGSQRLRVA